MIKEEYEVLYRLEGKYWWFLGQKRIAFSMLGRHLKKKENQNKLPVSDGKYRIGMLSYAVQESQR